MVSTCMNNIRYDALEILQLYTKECVCVSGLDMINLEPFIILELYMIFVM